MLKIVLYHIVMMAAVSAQTNYTFPAYNDTTGDLINYTCDQKTIKSMKPEGAYEGGQCEFITQVCQQ